MQPIFFFILAPILQSSVTNELQDKEDGDDEDGKESTKSKSSKPLIHPKLQQVTGNDIFRPEPISDGGALPDMGKLLELEGNEIPPAKKLPTPSGEGEIPPPLPGEVVPPIPENGGQDGGEEGQKTGHMEGKTSPTYAPAVSVITRAPGGAPGSQVTATKAPPGPPGIRSRISHRHEFSHGRETARQKYMRLFNEVDHELHQ